jgi:glyoxylase-like metal-dependent hydrolase (beta-lactamase superfamily II)
MGAKDAVLPCKQGRGDMTNRYMTFVPGRPIWLGWTIALMILVGLASVPLTAVQAQVPAEAPSMRIQAGITKPVSGHVYVIPANGRGGVPNVGIVVGSHAVLVIESGLGKPSGQVILDETRRIAGDRRIYVIATHAHPEHIGGEQAFPPSAIILRPLGQQSDLNASGAKLIDQFRSMSADNRLLLKDFAYRPADIIFSGSTTLDLGGVTVDIINAAPAHTDGDVAFLVRQDGVLFTGDVVQQNYAPVLGVHATPDSWLEQIDKLEKLPARIIVPSHTALTDRRAFGDMRELVTYFRDRWAAIKREGLSADAAANHMAADFKARFPACGNCDLVKMSVLRLQGR